MKRRHYTGLILIAAIAAVSTLYFNSLIVAVSNAAGGAATDRAAELSAGRYLDHVRHLAGSEMRGRGNGTPELDRAADYIASQFRLFGIRPGGEKGTYFQTFELTTGSEIGTSNALRLNGVALRLKADFVPLNFSATAVVEGPVVFVGYGITASEMHYDDYRGVDVKDKIVVALRHEPRELDTKSPFNGTNFTTHASFINKAINAKQHGARAIVFMTDPNNHPSEEDRVGEATRGTESDDSGIAAVHVVRDPILAMFEKAGKDLRAAQKKIDDDLEPQSFELADARVKLSTEVIRTRRPVRNVLGMVEGSDPTVKNEWIVIGAHYDHLGLGSRSSLSPSSIGQIHHGADDNASGTSGVLEMARVVAKNKGSLKRSVLFMTFAGEELGLLGSAHFVSEPTVPIENVVSMLNMDMIGRLSNGRLFVGGVGTSPKFKPWIEELNRDVGLNLDFSDSGYGSSDHTSFTIKKIPVLFFFSGLHGDYHKPSDTGDKINSDGARKVLTLAYLMLDRLATDTERPQYREEPRPTGGGAGGYGPYFGSIPDFRSDIKGVRFADVRPGSPAAKAGLKIGDTMVEFDGKPIQNLYDFTYALRAKKPGDMVSVVVERDGQKVTVEVKLEARR